MSSQKMMTMLGNFSAEAAVEVLTGAQKVTYAAAMSDQGRRESMTVRINMGVGTQAIEPCLHDRGLRIQEMARQLIRSNVWARQRGCHDRKRQQAAAVQGG